MSPSMELMMQQDLQEKKEREQILSKIRSENENKYLISCNNPWRKRWSYLIILVAIYSVAFIPMRISVYPTILDPVYTPLDIFTYFLYILDVIVNIRTTYMDSFGEEIKNTKQIFKHYAASFGFWIDILSLLNYPTSKSPILNIIGIAKVNRVLRIQTLIQRSNMLKGSKILGEMGYYYLLFIIYLHVVACLWFFFIEQTYLEHKDNNQFPLVEESCCHY